MLFDVVVPKEGKLRLIIAGSRFFEDHILLAKETNKFVRDLGVKEIEVVSGGARGADILGEYYAKHYKQDCTVIPAKWEEFGKSAGYRRNVEMAEYADACIVFWDGHSKGTLNMINIAKRYKMPLRIINYNDCENGDCSSIG